MSTVIILTCKNRVSDRFNLGVSYARKIETENRFDLEYDDVIKISPDLCTIPITNPDEYEVLSKIYSKNNLVNLGSISKCLTGEVDMTFAKKAMTQNSEDAKLIKGVQVDKYNVKFDSSEISQGEIEYLNLDLFKEGYKGKKLEDAYKKRIILQGLAGVNEKFRLKATLIDPPAFLANSCNYLVDKKQMPFNFILGLLNSKLLNFVFKCKSTSSNVNGYEVDNLPIPKKIPDPIQMQIKNIVDEILAAKKANPETDIKHLESQIDQMVYKLYNLTPEEIDIVKNSGN